MRENLFKGIRRDSGEWIEGQLLYFKASVGTEEFALISESCEWDTSNEWFNLCKRAKVIPSTIGQYTGVNDINANKIFEHDIVRKYVNGKELIGVVEFSDGAFGVRFADGSGQLLCFFGDCCEVIGNIHNDHEIILGYC